MGCTFKPFGGDIVIFALLDQVELSSVSREAVNGPRGSWKKFLELLGRVGALESFLFIATRRQLASIHLGKAGPIKV